MKFAILTDIHEDYESLKSAIKKIEKKNCDKIICLGDISGFSVPYYKHINSRNASKCLQLIKENCRIIIVGNHDLNASQRIPVNNPEFKYPGNWFELDYHEKRTISEDTVWLYDNDELNPLYSREDIVFLKTCPEYYVFDAGEYSILFSHYLYPNLTGSAKKFYYPDELDGHFSFMNEKNCSIAFCGHAHTQKGKLCFNEPLLKKMKHFNVSTNKVCIQCPPLVKSYRTGRITLFNTEALQLEFLKI